jgi:hypothetical protein
MKTVTEKIQELYELADQAKYLDTTTAQQRRLLNMLQKNLKKIQLEDPGTVKQDIEKIADNPEKFKADMEEIDRFLKEQDDNQD